MVADMLKVISWNNPKSYYFCVSPYNNLTIWHSKHLTLHSLHISKSNHHQPGCTRPPCDNRQMIVYYSCHDWFINQSTTTGSAPGPGLTMGESAVPPPFSTTRTCDDLNWGFNHCVHFCGELKILGGEAGIQNAICISARVKWYVLYGINVTISNRQFTPFLKLNDPTSAVYHSIQFAKFVVIEGKLIRGGTTTGFATEVPAGIYILESVGFGEHTKLILGVA